MTKVSELVSANVGNAILNYQTWGSILTSVKNPAFGAKGDGIVDDTAAINAADAAAVAAKTPLYFPPGTYKVTALTLNSQFIYGAGIAATEIKGSTATDNVITIPSASFRISDLKVTSSVAAASRTGAGIKITAGAEGLLRSIHSDGHRYGFWHQGNGNEFEHCFAVLNNSHGFFLDGTVRHQDEVGLYFCQSNANGGDGFRISGPGLGVRLTNVTAAANTEWAINVQSLNDVWLTTPEISGNGGGINVQGSSDVQIVSPFIETSNKYPNIWLRTSSMIPITGGFIQGATDASLGRGIIIEATDVIVSGTEITSHKVCGVNISAAAVRPLLSGVIISNTASTGVTSTTALLVDGGAAPFTMVGCDLASITNPISGAVPAGTVIAGCKGLITILGNGWTTSADAPINGFINFVDSTGVTRKVATIA